MYNMRHASDGWNEKKSTQFTKTMRMAWKKAETP